MPECNKALKRLLSLREGTDRISCISASLFLLPIIHHYRIPPSWSSNNQKANRSSRDKYGKRKINLYQHQKLWDYLKQAVAGVAHSSIIAVLKLILVPITFPEPPWPHPACPPGLGDLTIRPSENIPESPYVAPQWPRQQMKVNSIPSIVVWTLTITVAGKRQRRPPNLLRLALSRFNVRLEQLLKGRELLRCQVNAKGTLERVFQVLQKHRRATSYRCKNGKKNLQLQTIRCNSNELSA